MGFLDTLEKQNQSFLTVKNTEGCIKMPEKVALRVPLILKLIF